MDFKSLLSLLVANPALRDLLAPALQKAAALALRALADEVERDPALMQSLLAALAKAVTANPK